MDLFDSLLVFLVTLLIWFWVTTEVAIVTGSVALILSMVNLIISIDLYRKKRKGIN